MSVRRVPLHGLLIVLLALMVQIGTGALVPRPDLADALADINAICHAADESGGTPTHAPGHPADCPVCPLCLTLHAPAAVLVPGGVPLPPTRHVVVLRSELPPPSTAPPSSYRSPKQPRAPPILS